MPALRALALPVLQQVCTHMSLPPCDLDPIRSSMLMIWRVIIIGHHARSCNLSLEQEHSAWLHISCTFPGKALQETIPADMHTQPGVHGADLRGCAQAIPMLVGVMVSGQHARIGDPSPVILEQQQTAQLHLPFPFPSPGQPPPEMGPAVSLPALLIMPHCLHWATDVAEMHTV